MSLTLRAFGLRVCYFLGYFQERIDKLEAEIAVLKKQNELLGSTACLYIQKCDIEGCDKWCVDGDDAYMVRDNFPFMRYCENCHDCHCEEHAIQSNWDLEDDSTLCNTCK